MMGPPEGDRKSRIHGRDRVYGAQVIKDTSKLATSTLAMLTLEQCSFCYQFLTQEGLHS